MRILTWFVILTSTSSVAVSAAEPLVSGTPVGKRPGPYSFLVATGPQRGQQTCYICEQADKPTAVVFARTLSEPLGQLLVQLDEEAIERKESGFKVWMTQLTTNADLDSLAKWSQKQGIKTSPIGAFEDSDGPPSYKIHKDADITVLLFVKQKVVVNESFRSGELKQNQIQAIRKSVAKLFE